MFANRLRLSSVVLTGLATGGTGCTGPTKRSSTGEDDNKFVLDYSNTSSGTGDIMAGHNLPVGGSWP